MYWIMPAVVALWLSYLLIPAAVTLSLLGRWRWSYRISSSLAAVSGLASAAGVGLGLLFRHRPELMLGLPADAVQAYASALDAMATQSFRIAVISLAISVGATGLAIFARGRGRMLASAA